MKQETHWQRGHWALCAVGLGWAQLPWLALCGRSVTPVVLTSAPPSPPAQLLEGAPLQGHRPGGEGPAGCVWHQRPQHDLGRPAVDVPSLAAPGNAAVSGGSASALLREPELPLDDF